MRFTTAGSRVPFVRSATRFPFLFLRLACPVISYRTTKISHHPSPRNATSRPSPTDSDTIRNTNHVLTQRPNPIPPTKKLSHTTLPPGPPPHSSLYPKPASLPLSSPPPPRLPLLCVAMDISILDAGIDQFPNYSLITRPFQQLPEVGNVWASIFLLVAASAAFVGVVRQTELLTCRRRKGKSVISLPVAAYSDDSCSSSSDGDSDEDDDDDEDEDEDEDEEEEELLSSSGKYEYEPAGGSGIYGDDDRERDGRPFWPELGLGGAVVKTWEGLGLGLDRSAGGLISLLDLNRGEVLRSFLAGAGQIPVASLASPAVVLSAAERVGAAAVRVWDARAGGQAPAAAADWRPVRRRRVVGISGGGEGKVYVSDDVGAVSVADLRNIRSPLGELRWEPGSVNVDDLTESGRRGSVFSWCRNAARCLPLLPSAE